MRLTLFEDQAVRKLSPLTYLRPVWELKTGFRSLREKAAHAYGVEPSLRCRTFLADKVEQMSPSAAVNETSDGPTLFLNGRVIAAPTLGTTIPLEGPDEVLTQDERIVAIRVRNGSAPTFREDGTIDEASIVSLPHRTVRVTVVQYLWNLVHVNPREIEQDAVWLTGFGAIEGDHHPSAAFINKTVVTLRPGAVVGPLVVLDATNGPIVIDEGATIMPHATIIGPAYVGPKSVVKVGAKVYGGTTIGPLCKIGGEVEGTIVHGHSNKQHEGFLGHAYVGEWCNLGADTNNSDLKNNYGTVRVTVGGKEIDTGQQFVGLFLGDHGKSGINTMFNTGTVVGVASNVFGPGYPPKAIPSFAWYDTSKGLQTYELDKALAVAERVMARRNVPMTDADRELLRLVFEQTAPERSKP